MPLVPLRQADRSDERCPRRSTGPLRPVGGRPHPPGRHGPLGACRRGPPGRGRRAVLGVREGSPGADGPGRGAGPSELDVVIAGAVVVDPAVGVRQGGHRDQGRTDRRRRSGRQPAIGDGIDLPIGPHTQPFTGYGLIATPGAVDSHVHALSPELVPAALVRRGSRRSSPPGSRSRRGRWSGRSAGSRAGRSTSGCRRARGPRTTARSTRSSTPARCGFKIHEDYGAYPELIDHVLRFADAHDVTVACTPTASTSRAELEDTVAAIAGRTVHAYHVEGTGGGHLPDLLGLVREAEHHLLVDDADRPVRGQRGRRARPDDRPQPRRVVRRRRGTWRSSPERIHPATMAAEGPLHELGAIQIVNSDSQGMGRMMETVRRTFQLAHVMKAWRATTPATAIRACPTRPTTRSTTPSGCCATSPRSPSSRRSPTASPTTWVAAAGPARRHRAVEAGATSASSPSWCSRAAIAAWAPLGEGNATVERAEPTRYRADWGGLAGRGAEPVGHLRLGGRGADRPRAPARDAAATLVPRIGRTRGLTRADLARNRATAPIEIDSDRRPGHARRPAAGGRAGRRGCR